MHTLATNRREITLAALSLLNLRSKKRITDASHDIMVSCPIHGVDRNPSFGIDLDKGVCHCFSCGYSGSIENLYKTLTGQNLSKALGLSSDPFSSYARQPLKFSFYDKLDKSELLLKSVYVNFDAKKLIPYFRNKECKEYVKKRGINSKVAEQAKLQYCEEGRINGTLFKRRLIIPIYESGKLISIEGRRIYSEDPDPKVLYPKNCTVNTLYDLDNLDRSKTLYACEGLMDLLVLRGCDFFKNSTSIFGANITKRQLELFSEFNSVVYIADSDQAGQKTIEALKESKLDNLYSLALPKSINNIYIKDIGDIPKTGCHVQDLLNRKWLNYIKKLN